MIFTSDVYVVFLIAVFGLHWLLPVAVRKPFLIAASYLFYASWNWRYVFLLIALSLFNWSYARWLLTRYNRRAILLFGIFVNVGVLAYFKYANFFLDSVHAITAALGASWVFPVLQITLPLGISFFTFQGVAYLVDVASGEDPLRPLTDFLLFKALWSQLIAGPIIRISEIRTQIQSPRPLTSANVAAGARRIILGFNKKLVLADSIAPAVDRVFAAGAAPTGLDCLLGTLGFGLQIYFDFSAYSDIAIGSALLFGFVFPENFNWPYSAASPQEFWNRWHMTLSRWIRDYVFTPLSFAFRRQPRMQDLCLAGAMAICGLWHGANWTFVLWGLWHGGLLILNNTFLKGWYTRNSQGAWPRRAATVVTTFALVNLGWILFRAVTLSQAWSMLTAIATLRGGFTLVCLPASAAVLVLAVLAGLVIAFWSSPALTRTWEGLRTGPRWLRPARPLVDVALIHLAVVFMGSTKPFVYFQF